MLSFILLLIVCYIIGKTLFFIFRLSFGIVKFIFGIIFFPIIFVMFFFGATFFLLPIIIIGLIAFLVLHVAKTI